MAPARVPELLHLLNNSFSFTSFSTFFSFSTSVNPSLSLLYFSRCQQVDKVGGSAVLTVPTPFNKFLSRANSPSMPSLLIASYPPQHTSFFSFSLSKFSELSSCLPTDWDWEQEFCHWAAYTENPLICLVLVTVDISQSRLRLIVSWEELRLAEKFSKSIL